MSSFKGRSLFMGLFILMNILSVLATKNGKIKISHKSRKLLNKDNFDYNLFSAISKEDGDNGILSKLIRSDGDEFSISTSLPEIEYPTMDFSTETKAFEINTRFNKANFRTKEASNEDRGYMDEYLYGPRISIVNLQGSFEIQAAYYGSPIIYEHCQFCQQVLPIGNDFARIYNGTRLDEKYQLGNRASEIYGQTFHNAISHFENWKASRANLWPGSFEVHILPDIVNALHTLWSSGTFLKGDLKRCFVPYSIADQPHIVRASLVLFPHCAGKMDDDYLNSNDGFDVFKKYYYPSIRQLVEMGNLGWLTTESTDIVNFMNVLYAYSGHINRANAFDWIDSTFKLLNSLKVDVPKLPFRFDRGIAQISPLNSFANKDQFFYALDQLYFATNAVNIAETPQLMPIRYNHIFLIDDCKPLFKEAPSINKRYDTEYIYNFSGKIDKTTLQAAYKCHHILEELGLRMVFFNESNASIGQVDYLIKVQRYFDGPEVSKGITKLLPHYLYIYIDQFGFLSNVDNGLYVELGNEALVFCAINESHCHVEYFKLLDTLNEPVCNYVYMTIAGEYIDIDPILFGLCASILDLGRFNQGLHVITLGENSRFRSLSHFYWREFSFAFVPYQNKYLSYGYHPEIPDFSQFNLDEPGRLELYERFGKYVQLNKLFSQALFFVPIKYRGRYLLVAEERPGYIQGKYSISSNFVNVIFGITMNLPFYSESMDLGIQVAFAAMAGFKTSLEDPTPRLGYKSESFLMIERAFNGEDNEFRKALDLSMEFTNSDLALSYYKSLGELSIKEESTMQVFGGYLLSKLLYLNMYISNMDVDYDLVFFKAKDVIGSKALNMKSFSNFLQKDILLYWHMYIAILKRSLIWERFVLTNEDGLTTLYPMKEDFKRLNSSGFVPDVSTESLTKENMPIYALKKMFYSLYGSEYERVFNEHVNESNIDLEKVSLSSLLDAIIDVKRGKHGSYLSKLIYGMLFV